MVIHTNLLTQLRIVYMRLFAGLPGMTLHDAESFWFVSHEIAPGDIILTFDAPQKPEQAFPSRERPVSFHRQHQGDSTGFMEKRTRI